MTMGKTKRALLNTVATMLQMIVAQIISLFVSRKVLEVYGSDLNGVNAILSNMMEWILLLEGGLTLASNVALFKPYVSGDYDRCNRILSATKKQFEKIGLLVLGAGIVLAIVYPFFIKTDIPHWDIFLMFTIMSLSTSFSVFYTRKYALMFNVSQSEYINTITTTVLTILGNAVVYIVALNHWNYLIIRTIYLLTTIVTGLLLSMIVKKRYAFADYKVEPDFSAIKGTKDVVFQKITALLRNSAPLLFISMLISSTFASVYSVYIFIYGFVQKLVMMVINATQSGIGQLIAQRERHEVYRVYRVFEFASTVAVLWLVSVAVPMTMPFIRFYTHNVTDVNYVDWWLLFFIAGNIVLQVLHIPSGIIINMSGAFKEDKNYQLISCGVMLVAALVFGCFFGVYGVLGGIMLASVVLGFCEIRYTRSVFFKESYRDLFKPILLIAAVMVPACWLEIGIVPYEFTIPTFCLFGVILALANAVLVFLVVFLFERERTNELITRLKSTIRRSR